MIDSLAGIRSHLATIITLSLGIGQQNSTGNESYRMPLCKLFDTQVIFKEGAPDCTTTHVSEDIHLNNQSIQCGVYYTNFIAAPGQT